MPVTFQHAPMNSPRKVTFRMALVGVITDFLAEAAMHEPHLADALTSIAIALAGFGAKKESSCFAHAY